MRRFLLVMLLCCFMGGCAHKIEITQLGIVAGFGIDKTDTGYSLTAQVINPSSIAGNHENTLPVFTISAEGTSIFEAYRRLSTLTSKVLYLPHLSVIVIDEEIANNGINVVIDAVLRNIQLRPNISLFVAKGIESKQILKVLVPYDNVPINRLDSLSNMCVVCSSREVNYTLYDISQMINAKGTNLVLNAVSIKGYDPVEGEKLDNILEVDSPVQFQISNLAAFKNEKLVGYLNDDEAQFYNLIVGNAKRFIVDVKTDEGYDIVFESRKSKSQIKPNLSANAFEIDCEVEGVLMQNDYPIDLTNPDNIKTLQTYLEVALKEDVLNLVEKTQRDFTSDILGVGSEIYKKDSKKWGEVEGYWDEIYPTLTPQVKVKVKITSVGNIQNLHK